LLAQVTAKNIPDPFLCRIVELLLVRKSYEVCYLNYFVQRHLENSLCTTDHCDLLIRNIADNLE